ncbi:hypothetical protein NADFUDRAFT_57271 [Nadsonia fulvescens var. elongata DSM 6958]|uniref:DNA repair and recombination protein RAD26 n=1 Tax=Nadsonia fulvescens var. elongata DSM 6958 TaxID=857566 RepID=A0A1E3PNR7_9ASCO|nr:hypothetical protein NADFUDRAFT_57271 [Nadsonia fulvescens var. elongata DSM 6958]
MSGLEKIKHRDNEPDADQDFDSLGVFAVEQDALEKNVASKANAAMMKKEEENDQKRLAKSLKAQDLFRDRIFRLNEKISNRNTRISEKESLRKEIQQIKDFELATVEQDIKDIQDRIKERAQEKKQTEYGDSANLATEKSSDRLPGETEHDFLVRTGKITPFANTTHFIRDSQQQRARSNVEGNSPVIGENINDDDYKSSEESISSNDEDYNIGTTGNRKSGKLKLSKKVANSNANRAAYNKFRNLDDGDEFVYQQRVSQWIRKRGDFRRKLGVEDSCPDEDEWLKTHPTEADAVLEGSFKIPGDIYPSLFDYQKTGVQWLWELYTQKTGGIIGDEMGLGKTIQVVSFIAGLHYSGKLNKPVLVVCPATVMRQWVNEFHTWWPPLRVAILHSIGSGVIRGSGSKKDFDSEDEEFFNTEYVPEESEPFKPSSSTKNKISSIIDRVFEKGHVLVTTYAGLRSYRSELLNKNWGICVLDEGHKIRNPDSDISLVCKQVKTPHRVILSGTPIQNNLTELWSLFDFVFPGRLGTLPVFQTQFSVPINIGGYANATNIQVQTAYKCAVVLRDLITPYMLRRMKADVASDLPKKSEKVLFCRLTKQQKDAYVGFLKSKEMESISTGRRQMLYGVDILRKICNHPDLADRDTLLRREDYDYGAPHKSGKMQVLKALLDLWISQGHRTLLFSQTRQTLDILEMFVSNLNGVKFLRMDGTTAIGQRQALVDKFNDDASYHIMLLTTRVGGLGVNLTGANRVIIYDPDWNPSTDVQARERAWRLGQKKDVIIYRLMIAGSIEEKIYHRQIFKQFLTNKILKDPKQKRFFKMNDLHDLFVLGNPDDEEGGTETGGLFSGVEKQLNNTVHKKNPSRFSSGSKRKKTQVSKDSDDFYSVAEMNGVSSLVDYQTGEEEKDKKRSKKNSDEDGVLEGIFSNSGVYSTLEHDSIMEATRPETLLVEREASRVASEAAQALKESRRIALRAQIGTPTWTGKFGSAGRFGRSSPSSQIPNGMSSKSILQSIKYRRELEEKATSTAADTVNLGGGIGILTDVQKTGLISRIRDYLASQPDKMAKSLDIIQNLNMKVTGPQEVATVRQMLKELATWNGDQSKWSLKTEYE